MLVAYRPPWFPVFFCGDHHGATPISRGTTKHKENCPAYFFYLYLIHYLNISSFQLLSNPWVPLIAQLLVLWSNRLSSFRCSRLLALCQINLSLVYIYPTPPLQVGKNTKSISSRGQLVWIYRFFFSFAETCYLITVKEPSLPYYLLIAGVRRD